MFCSGEDGEYNGVGVVEISEKSISQNNWFLKESAIWQSLAVMGLRSDNLAENRQESRTNQRLNQDVELNWLGVCDPWQKNACGMKH